MRITLTIANDPPITTTLEEFLDANALDQVDLDDIGDAMLAGRRFDGGGGAAVGWSIEPVGAGR